MIILYADVMSPKYYSGVTYCIYEQLKMNVLYVYVMFLNIGQIKAAPQKVDHLTRGQLEF